MALLLVPRGEQSQPGPGDSLTVSGVTVGSPRRAVPTLPRGQSDGHCSYNKHASFTSPVLVQQHDSHNRYYDKRSTFGVLILQSDINIRKTNTCTFLAPMLQSHITVRKTNTQPSDFVF